MSTRTTWGATALLTLMTAACGVESPVAPVWPDAPAVAAVRGGQGSSPAAPDFDPYKYRFYQTRYYADGRLLHCEAVPANVGTSDFVRTFRNGTYFIHTNGVDAYVLVTEAPAHRDASGAIVPDPYHPEAWPDSHGWLGRGRLSATLWGAGSDLLTSDGAVDGVVAPTEAVGLPAYPAVGTINELVRDHAGSFDQAIAGGADTFRARCRMDLLYQVGKIITNEVEVSPLTGRAQGKRGR